MRLRMVAPLVRARTLNHAIRAALLLGITLSMPVAAATECSSLSAEALKSLPAPTDILVYGKGDLFVQLDSTTNTGGAARSEQLKKTLRLDDAILSIFNPTNVIDVVVAHKQGTGHQLIVAAVKPATHTALGLAEKTNPNLKFFKDPKGVCGFATYSVQKGLLGQNTQEALATELTDLFGMGRQSGSPFWAVAVLSVRSHEKLRKFLSDPSLVDEDVIQKLQAVAMFTRIRPDSLADVTAKFAYRSEKDANANAKRLYAEVPGYKQSLTIEGRFVTIELLGVEFGMIDAFLDLMR